MYPLAITLILLALLSPLFKDRQVVYVTTTLFTLVVSVADLFKALPKDIQGVSGVKTFLAFCTEYLPLFSIGMGWILPATIGFIVGLLISWFTKPTPRSL